MTPVLASEQAAGMERSVMRELGGEARPGFRRACHRAGTGSPSRSRDQDPDFGRDPFAPAGLR